MILVTGATGMTGQFVVKELLSRGYDVGALARESSVDKVPPGAEIFVGDLGDAESLGRAAESAQGIVHTACTFKQYETDIAAMEALVNAWQAGPFVFVSSLDVYGLPQEIPVTEDHPLVESVGAYPQGDVTGYAYGKVCCERLLIEKAKETNRTDYAILRAPHIWGPHIKAHKQLKKKKIEAGEPITLPGETEEEWSQYGDAWIDVRDLAKAIALCITTPSGNAMNALNGHFCWHELFTHLIQLMGSDSQLSHRPQAEIAKEPFGGWFYAQAWRFSNQRLVKQLGYEPEFSLAQTLKDTLQMAKSN